MLLRNFLHGEDGITVKATFYHYLSCLRGFAVCKGLASRLCGEITEAFNMHSLLLIHVGINDTIKVNAEHTKCEHRVLSVRSSAIVVYVRMSLLLPDNGKETSRCR